MIETIKNMLVNKKSKFSVSKPLLWGNIESTALVSSGDQNLIDRVKKKTGWSQIKTEKNVAEYRKFLYLATINDNVVPAKDVDEVWHEHLLFTRDYNAFCNNVLGKQIHHEPEVPNKPNKFKDDYKKTGLSYQKEFGETPEFAGVWDFIAGFAVSESFHSCPSSHSHHDTSPSYDSSPSHSCSSAHSCSSVSSCSSGSSCGGSSCGGGGD